MCLETKNVFRINFDLQNKLCKIHCAKQLRQVLVTRILHRTKTYIYKHTSGEKKIWKTNNGQHTRQRVIRKLAFRFPYERYLRKSPNRHSLSTYTLSTIDVHSRGWARMALARKLSSIGFNCSNYNLLFEDASAYFHKLRWWNNNYGLNWTLISIERNGYLFCPKRSFILTLFTSADFMLFRHRTPPLHCLRNVNAFFFHFAFTHSANNAILSVHKRRKKKKNPIRT